MSLIELKEVRKNYGGKLEAVKGVSFSIEEGEFVAIMGPSGSGKSTTMNLIGLLDSITGGEYFLDGQDVGQLSSRAKATVRNQKLGFVFQSFHLLPSYTALENVMLPFTYRSGSSRSHVQELAQKSLERVGLAERVRHYPREMSGGEQQRVAIARALVTEPKVILADEPTGNLDTQTSYRVMSLFQELHEQGKTVILVTHEPDIALYAERVLFFKDGLLEEDGPPKEVLKSSGLGGAS